MDQKLQHFIDESKFNFKDQNKVLVFNDADSGEPDESVFMEQPGEAERFFQNLITNSEENTDHKIKLATWTKEECEHAILCGENWAGHMTDDESDAFHATKPTSRL